MILDPAPCPRDTGEIGGVTPFPSKGGGLIGFGAVTGSLMPGIRSGRRPRPAEVGEFLHTLDGVVILRGKAGVPEARQPENRSHHPVTCCVAGSPLPADEVTCPDIDPHCIRRNGLRARLHKDGTRHTGWLREATR